MRKGLFAKIEIKSQNKLNIPDSAKIITLKTNDPKVLDEMEKLPYTGSLLKIDKLMDLTVKGTTDLEVQSKGDDDVKLYAWSENDDQTQIAIQIIDEQEKP
jgi:hypothetical protein